MLLLLTAGGFFRIRQITTGLPADRFSDSYAAVEPAIGLSNAWKAGVFALDPHSYFYPTLYTYLLAVTFFFFGRVFHHEAIGRFISSSFGLLTAIPTYVIARSLFSRYAGLVAASFVCFGFAFVIEGRYPSPDSLQLFLYATGLAVLFGAQEFKMKNILFSGLFIGLATGTKWTASIFAAPVVLVFLFQHATRGKEYVHRLSAFSMAVAVGFLLTTPTFIPQLHNFLATQAHVGHLAKDGLIGVPPLGFFGYLFSNGGPAYMFPYWPSLRQTMGLPWVLASLISAAILLWASFKKKKPGILALIVGILVTYPLFVLKFHFYAGRIILPLTLGFTICVSGFLHLILSQVKMSRGSRCVIKFGLPALLIAPSVFLCFQYASALSSPDTRLLAVNWIVSHVPENSCVLNFINGPALPNRYKMFQWPMFESRDDLIQQHGDWPSVALLKEQKIDWIIWNETLNGRILSHVDNQTEEEYLRCWRAFRFQLNNPQIAVQTFIAENPFSPRIEIFNVRRG